MTMQIVMHIVIQILTFIHMMLLSKLSIHKVNVLRRAKVTAQDEWSSGERTFSFKANEVTTWDGSRGKSFFEYITSPVNARYEHFRGQTKDVIVIQSIERR